MDVDKLSQIKNEMNQEGDGNIPETVFYSKYRIEDLTKCES